MEFAINLLKKPGEEKFAVKFGQCFNYLDEIIKLDAKFKEEKDFSKQINSKSEIFLKNIKNIFSEIFIELQRHNELMRNHSSNVNHSKGFDIIFN